MKTTITALIFAALPTLALSGGAHDMALGSPAHHKATRTVEMVMKEDYNAELVFVYEPKELTFEAGETVRLHIINKGEEVHEFVMDTIEENAKHKAMMEKFPEMEHDDPNAVRLEPGEEAEIIWTFGKPGSYEFACLIPGHYEGGMHGPLTVN